MGEGKTEGDSGGGGGGVEERSISDEKEDTVETGFTGDGLRGIGVVDCSGDSFAPCKTHTEHTCAFPQQAITCCEPLQCPNQVNPLTALIANFLRFGTGGE